MRARVPGSSSNLGPGYDALGLALRVYVEVEITPAGSLSVMTEGEGADLPQDGSHLAAAVARSVLGHDAVAIRVRSSIPLSRGLGSSAALAVAAAAAAGADDPLQVAAGCDGHAENAAASVLGGLVAAAMLDGGRSVARRLPLDPGLGFAIVVPDRHLPTKLARSVLPAAVPLADAAYNLGRMGLLVAGLADSASLVAEAGDDRLHQSPRATLFPEARELMARLRDGGATLACWSGAGPALLAICADRADLAGVVAAGERALDDLAVPGEVRAIEPDRTGLVVCP